MITMNDMSAETGVVLNAAPVAWDALADSWGDAVTNVVSRDLDSVAIGAARRAAYFNARGLGLDHAKAVKASNRVVRTLAKVLGYAYPKSHELRF